MQEYQPPYYGPKTCLQNCADGRGYFINARREGWTGDVRCEGPFDGFTCSACESLAGVVLFRRNTQGTSSFFP